MVNWREYFIMNKRERKSVIVLLIIIFTFYGLRHGYQIYLNSKPYSISPISKEEADSFIAGLSKRSSYENLSRVDKFILEKYDSLQLFNFDPNTATNVQFLKLGLTEKQVATIINYREKGGRFYQKDDFKKMYGLRQIQFDLLKPYIQLPEHNSATKLATIQQIESSKVYPYSPDTISKQQLIKWGLSEKQADAFIKFRDKSGGFKKSSDIAKITFIPEDLRHELEINAQTKKVTVYERKYTAVDLNEADTSSLNALPGIGQTLAARIIAYRNKLGGFASKNQLLEVYGFNQKLLSSLDTLIKPISSKTALKKIKINFADFKELKHPYLSYDQVKAIINHRSKYGMFTDASKLQNAKLLPDSVFQKVNPYFIY